MKSVTAVINDMHLDNGTIGSNRLGKDLGSPLNPSINISSAYAFQSIGELEAYHENRNDNTRYARDGNALARQVEEYFSKIYKGNVAYLFNSGMASISAAFYAAVSLQSYDYIVTTGVYYRKTNELIKEICKYRQIQHLHFHDIEQAYKRCSKNKVLFFIENFSNPFLRITSLEEIKKRIPHCSIILDFTLQGLLNNSSDIELADYAVSSCTKYIGGHNDFLAGVALVKSR